MYDSTKFATSKKGSFSTAADIAERKDTLRPRRDLKYLNATVSVSSAGGDVAGFEGDASESRRDGLGTPSDGNTMAGLDVGADCVSLNTVSDAEDAEADTGDGWVVKVNGLAPAPKPTKPPNFGGGTAS